jgi:hypothetical protein
MEATAQAAARNQRLRDDELREAINLENTGTPENRMAVIRWRAICAQVKAEVRDGVNT